MTTLRGKIVTTAARLAIAGIAIVAGACSTSRPGAPLPSTPAPQAVESGFLTDYSRLQASEQFAALRFWRDDSRKKGYRKLRIRPVEVWRSSDKLLQDIPDDDLQYLADAFYRAIQGRLAQSFEMVDKAGPGVLDIQLGLTLVTDPQSKIDFFSTEVPVKDLAAKSGPISPATRRFVQDCALEAEFDEVAPPPPGASERKAKKTMRAAIFDTRHGTETPKGKVQSWEDVHAVFERWAALLDERLASLRDGSFKPKLTVRKDAAQRQ